MLGLYQIWEICWYNFRRWRKNPRIIITFGLAFVLCFLLTDNAIRFSYEYNTIIQVIEPFVWTFGDSNSILLASLLLILLFSDMPFLDAGVPYFLMRTSRLKWLMGQILYICLAVFIYMVFILVSTIVICAKNAYVGNMWSETAAILGYSGAGQVVALPSSVKTMEMSTPYECMVTIFLLMLLYTLLCVLIMFVMNLRKGHFWGILSVFIFNLYGFLLNPQLFKEILKLSQDQLYIANVVTGWASPLQHATYHMHNFGYDLLPKLWQTYFIYVVLISMCLLLALLSIRKYNFNFSGGLN
ncbi:MAG: hypothetical protein WBI74_10855 [Caldicoprobacterales bacterium]|jgi:hypothetical protein|nr:hypothetical protein [Clostridiales bacterium]